ncbi:MAG: HDOD domain-containing protein, partial [Planctomycetota bacterium]|nr:HDOD domain-containing protein [Planctomycetota bacterium]
MERRFDEMRLARDLPTPSAVGLKILELTARSDYDQDELVSLIGADPALSGRVLRLANNMGRSTEGSVSSVQQAAARLGPDAVRKVALGFSLLETRMPVASRFCVDSFWSQSLACAVSAEMLAKSTGKDPASFFTLGLLSGIGRLALACVHPERYGRICCDPRAADEASMLQLEWRTFEIDHLDVGACLLEDSGLPETFSQAIEQTSPRKAVGGESQGEWALLLIVARLIGRVLSPHASDPLGDRARALTSLPSAVEQMGLSPDSFTG